ncbi:MAG: ABC-F family ATP-binding cassette domain-containing protein [Candidatus Solibacter usitatus]|nr:ABC-F family ATP-binding cassette domain-containing protein [Candidatus Solibacter usitatus]
MIQLTEAAKRFGTKVLFENCNWLIGPKERVGIVGGNGTGKSTMLKILSGMEQLDHGDVSAMKGIRFGYLPQEGLTLSGRTVFDECLSTFADVQAMETEMTEAAHQMGEVDPASEEYAILADRYHHLEGLFHSRDGYAIESQVGTVLAGLGFAKEDWARRTEQFSGGWQMRIALAKLLLEKPNLLLLDEPTNHLDLEARNWLESYLREYPNSFILISHDRYFLDVTVDRLLEIWNKKVWFYPGNYTKYLQLKQERLDHLKAAARNQNERIEQLEAFINRFRYQATKAKQVQSRIKELEKIERIEIPPEEQTIHFSFPQPKSSGRVVAEFANVAKSYGAKPVFEKVNFLIERGDRVALVGVNGAGKSTLIKLLEGSEPLTSGTYNLGHNAEPGYFAQDQYKELDPDSRLFDDLISIATNRTQTELRTLLGCFLFGADDAFKKIGVLSGGERNRYALARLLLAPTNFLLLDEPTNHLDMRAKDVLLEALRRYTGTLVFVSHDRYFIENLATKVFEIGGGEVRVYTGTFADYLWRKEQEANGLISAAATVAAQVVVKESKPAKRVNPIKLKQLTDKCSSMEKQIASLEERIAHKERELAVFQSAEQSMRLSSEIDADRAALEKLVADWELAAQEMQAVQA